jgi:hypothetical protein
MIEFVFGVSVLVERFEKRERKGFVGCEGNFLWR